MCICLQKLALQVSYSGLLAQKCHNYILKYLKLKQNMFLIENYSDNNNKNVIFEQNEDSLE